MLGGLLALLASATFALSNVSTRRGVLTGSVLQALVVSIWLGIPVFLAAALGAGALGGIAQFSASSTVILALAGIVHFVLGRYCNYRAIAAIGVNLAGPVQEISMLVALVLAVGLLGEELSALKMVGIVLVLAGPAIILRVQGAGRRGPGKAAGEASGATSGGFRPRYAEGFGFALLSAVAYGASPILVRAGLRDTDPGIAIVGGLVSYIAAAIVVAPLLLRPATRRDVLALRFPAAKWFTVGGVVLSLSQMIRYMALSIAPVTIVAPIQRLSVIFRLLFGWMINRQHEVFGVGVLGGIAVSLVGALALTLDAEFVVSVVALPEWAIEIARWRWPGE